jgi:predicted nuclease of predicted toxin-antitoxin system
MRFLADENISRHVIDRLRADGFEVISIAETMPGAADNDIVKVAGEDSILLTEDTDFGELVVRQQLRVGGIMLLELDRLTNTAEAKRTSDVVSAYGEKLAGNLTVVEPARIRVRPLSR